MVEVDACQIAKSLIFLMLLPLGVGLFIRGRYEQLSATLQPVAAQVSTVAIAILMVSLLIVNFEDIIDTIGTGGIAAALIVLVGALLIGSIAGGSSEENRSVLALGTAQRNLSAAIVAAVQNSGDDPEVITMVMVVGVLGLILLFAAAGEFGKRSLKKTPEAGDGNLRDRERDTAPSTVQRERGGSARPLIASPATT